MSASDGARRAREPGAFGRRPCTPAAVDDVEAGRNEAGRNEASRNEASRNVTETKRRTRSALARIGVSSAVAVALATAAVSCGGENDDAGSGGDTPVATQVGGADPVNGEQLSRSQGCAGCHGGDFGGGAGPGWIGLAGSERLLDDGTTVVADTAYLTRAIADPSAEVVADSTLRMPANNLSDAEIADIVAFIETLSGR
jgi:mono/diheme cytochrome c family protein